MAYYVFDDDKNIFESMTKEEVLAAIASATGKAPKNIDDAVVSKFVEQNKNKNLKFWIGTQAEYSVIDKKDADTLYLISDKTEYEDLIALIDRVTAVQSLTNALSDRVTALNNAVSNRVTALEKNVQIKKRVRRQAVFRTLSDNNAISASDLGFTSDDVGKDFTLNVNIEVYGTKNTNALTPKKINSNLAQAVNQYTTIIYTSSYFDHVSVAIVSLRGNNATDNITIPAITSEHERMYVNTELIVYA